MLSYALVGGLATAVHYLVLVALVELADVERGPGGGDRRDLRRARGVRRQSPLHVRKRCARTAARLPRFLLVAALGAATSAALVFAGTEWLGLHYLLPQVAATALVLAAGFTLNRHWTFA